MEPVHIQLNANDFTVSLINASHQALKNVTVIAKVINSAMDEAWSYTKTLSSVSPDCYLELTSIPQKGKYSYNYFVKLELRNADNHVISDNLYWFYSQHMDFCWFTTMEKPELKQTVNIVKKEGEYQLTIHVKNETKKLSHFNHFTLKHADTGEEIHPVFWSDNFITLFPGDEKIIHANVAIVDAVE